MQENINLNLEPLNISVDHVGNFLRTTRMGAEMFRAVMSRGPEKSNTKRFSGI